MREGFKPLETFQKARRYIEKQLGSKMGDVERKNLKTMYETLGEKYVVGVQKQLCPFCNTYSDGGGIMAIRKDEAEKDAGLLKIICMACMELSKILVTGYNFNADEFHKLMNELRKIKEERGV